MKKPFFPLIIAIFAIQLCSCFKSEQPFVKNDPPKTSIETPPPTVLEMHFDSDANSSLMYTDNESKNVFTSTDRVFEMKNVLEAKAINNTTMRIRNYTPCDIEDATIVAQITEFAQKVQLLKIKKIRAHAEQIFEYSFVKGGTRFLDTDGAEVSLDKFKTVGIPTADIQFDFTGTSAQILRLKKLANVKWEIWYGEFGSSASDNWKYGVTPKDIRRLSGLFINAAYLIQTENFKAEFLKEEIVRDDGYTQLTLTQKINLYQQMIDKPQFRPSVCTKSSGLAAVGGSLIGVAEHVLLDFLKMNTTDILFHEIGHNMGYNHGSTMTYDKNGKGFVMASGRISNKILNANDYPIRSDNYYKPSDMAK